MKLSELIAFRNRLQELPVSEAKNIAQSKLDVLIHKIEQPLEQPVEQLTAEFIPEIQSKYNDIQQAFNSFDQTIDQVKRRIQEQIAEQEKQWFQESYKIFEQAETCETTDQILYGRKSAGGKNSSTIEAETTLRSRLASYADWRFSGIVIRPGLENFIEEMVGCDPLYIVDRNYDLLKPSIERFPKSYQNRLRPYTVNEWSDEPLMSKIPNKQFGVCLAYNVFDYRPLEIIRRYLEEIYQKLLPGGYLLMTYNDCDREKAVMLVEQCCASYTPGYLIRDLAAKIGFNQTFSWSDGGPSVWLELRKPGELTSLRGGQAIATIRRTDDYLDDIDFLKRRVYNKEEIEELHQEARRQGAEESVIEQYKPYELEQHVNELRRQHHAEEIRLREEAQIQHAESERQRILALHEEAKSLSVVFDEHTDELEIARLISEALDKRRKDELRFLRQRAMELKAGDPNLIRYGYSAEKLKQLIKEKEEGQQ